MVNLFQAAGKDQNFIFDCFFCLKGKWLQPNTFTGVLFSDTEELWNVWAKTECCFPNQPSKNWSICFEVLKRVQISYFVAFFCRKGKWLQPKTFTGVLFSETEGLWNVWVKTECCLPNQPPPKKKKKIGQFVSSCRKGYKFHILLLSFVWKVSWLNQKTFTGVSFCDSEGPCKHWAKTKCCFPNQPPKNWSICFELTNKVQIWHFIGMFCLKHKLIEAKPFTRLLFCDTEGPWDVWVETE